MLKNVIGKTVVAVAVLGLSLAVWNINTSKAETTKEIGMHTESVTAAVENFYSALNVMFTGEGEAMKAAWSHADDVTYMGPSGEYLIGWENIKKEWDLQTAAKLGGTVRPDRIQIVTGEKLAILTCVEVGENVIDGKSETVNLRSSTTFRLEGGAWKVIGHQTDKLGYMNPSE